MSDCVFCKIVEGEITPEKIYETGRVLAFRDLHPQAPTHVLVIPKKHIATIDDLVNDDRELIGDILLAIAEIARNEGLTSNGYRTVANCGSDGGQTVFHIHWHLLGGRQMTWPPG